MNFSDRIFTIITGASQGLGRAFAEVCAQRNQNLVLVSLPNEHIGELAKCIEKKHGVKVIYIETDLTQLENIMSLITELKKYKINMLINNAGVGGTKVFGDAPLAYIEKILLLNMRALIILTHQLLPNLKEQKKAHILNISSLAAISPMPFKTIYPASKAFIYSFSRGLNAELEGSNIHVSVALLGGMPTNEEVTQRIKAHNRFVKLSILSPEETAMICMKQLLRQRAIIIPGRINRLSAILQRFVPEKLQLKIMKNKLQKEFLTFPH